MRGTIPESLAPVFHRKAVLQGADAFAHPFTIYGKLPERNREEVGEPKNSVPALQGCKGLIAMVT